MAQMPKITLLFLDIGGVLLSNGWDRGLRQKAAETFGLNYAEMDERHHLTFDTFEEGKISLFEYLQRVVFYQERPFSVEEFRAFMFSESKPYPEMIDLIRRVKQQHGVKIAAVSNEGRELSSYRTETFGLRDFIDFFIVSCYLHFRKPDTDLYRAALDVAQVPPEQTLYIDDRAMFVEVAERFGIRGIIHTDHDSTRQALGAYGLGVAGDEGR